jgi:energy-coupling factor transport system permease protein
MQTDFDLYVRRNSWLHALDPRAKLLFIVDACLLVFLWPTVWTALAVIALGAACFWQAQIPPTYLARIWRMMGPLMILVFVLTAIFGGAGPAWMRVGPLAVTPASVQLGAMLGLRLLALALVIFLWMFTTDQATMIRGFLALRLPYEWGLTLALALRYLPIFAGLFTQVREAQQARGLELEQRSFFERLTAYRPVLVAMIITALRQSEHLGWALESRALGSHGVRRTTFRPLRLRRTDFVALVALAAVLLAEIIMRVL